MKLKTLFFLLFISFRLYAQKETNNWLFGYHARLNFNVGAPVPISGGKVNTTECSASISDTSGNLLFYTDGTNVFDKNNNQMPNGFGLLGHESATQGALIIRKPESANLYYIFSINTACVKEFVYSIVDMNENGGMGDVILKNKILRSEGNYFEKLTAVKHCNNRDVWIIIMGGNLTGSGPLSIYSFLLNPYGIIDFPTISNLSDINLAQCFGQLKSSPQGNYLAFGTEQGFSLAGYNKNRGELTTVKTYSFPHFRPYGSEFSPDGKLYYFNKAQVEIASGNITPLGYPTFSQFQLASDNKIYFNNYDSTQMTVSGGGFYKFNVKKLSRIEYPNNIGFSANLSTNVVSLGNDSSFVGLPNFPSYHFYHPTGEFSYKNDCAGDTTVFNLVKNLTLDSLRWTFHDDNSTSSQLHPSHIYNLPGTYEVSVITHLNGNSDTVKQCVTINGIFQNIFNQNDTLLCSENEVLIGVNYPYLGRYLWNTGDTTAGILVNQEGEYWLRITNSCASYTDTITVIKANCEPEIFVPNVFTPNGDNSNDEFRIILKGAKELQYSIYDRWGNEIKNENLKKINSAPAQNIYLWDGTNEGLSYSDGVYYLVIYYISVNDKTFRKSGFFTLLK